VDNIQCIENNLSGRTGHPPLDSRALAEHALQSLVDLVVVVDPDFVPVKANNAFLKANGMASDQFDGANTLFQLANGLWDVPVVRETIMVAQKEHRHAHCEFALNLSRLGTRALNMTAVTLEPESEYPGFVMISIRDDTERKKIEDERCAKERTEALVAMAHGVFHRFNNLLQEVTGGVQLASVRLDSGNTEGLQPLLRDVLERSLLGAGIVKTLGDFVRLHTEDAEFSTSPFDLSRTVIKALEIANLNDKAFEGNVRAKTVISMELEPGCLVSGTEVQIRDAVINLLINASEAMPRDAEIKLKTFSEGEEVVLVVRYQGIGIAPDNISKVFWPLWSSKGGQSQGMGLAITDAAITRHGGRISVKSEEGVGTTFVCRLPLAHPTCLPGSEAKDACKTYFRILIIDDEVSLVRMLEEGLTALGQTVFPASSGTEGLQIFREVPVDVVICDLNMDDMNGWQVATAMKKIREEKNLPKVPFILFTGWAGQQSQTDLIERSGVDRIVGKPTALKDLLRVVDEVAGPTKFESSAKSCGKRHDSQFGISWAGPPS
jgi:signal transduction histidine kinase/ActR/RegA family two-component response regulator